MPLKTKRALKQTLLFLRHVIFRVISLFTSSMRKKKLDTSNVSNIVVFAQKRMGDSIVSIPAFKAIKGLFPKCPITVFSISYIQDILERIEEIDKIVTYGPNDSFFQKIKKANGLARNRFDLAFDLTCDYTLEAGLWAFVSRAKFRVGYNTCGRGFLFHKSIVHQKKPIHITEEILDIVRSIHPDVKNTGISLSASRAAQDAVRQTLQNHQIHKNDICVGIHPGGHYPTQRWLEERFAELADKMKESDPVKIILLGGPKELDIIRRIENRTAHKPLILADQPIPNLLALIQSLDLLICNNSGPLHLATALGTPTVSLMGPTLPERWWPQGTGHVVIRKELDCMPCNEGFCPLGTHDCMKLITVEDALLSIHPILRKIAEDRV